MKTQYKCEGCGMVFGKAEDCQRHEKACCGSHVLITMQADFEYPADEPSVRKGPCPTLLLSGLLGIQGWLMDVPDNSDKNSATLRYLEGALTEEEARKKLHDAIIEVLDDRAEELAGFRRNVEKTLGTAETASNPQGE